MRLGLLELPRAHVRGVTLTPVVALPTGRPRDELLRRFHGPLVLPEVPPSDAPTRRPADLDEHELGEVLARGVGRSITSDGLEWLLQRHHGGAVTPAALPLPPSGAP